MSDIPVPSENARPVSLAPPGEGDRLAVLGDLMTLKLPSAATGRTLCALEVRTPPGGGPPPHTHRQAEVFYVLSGDVQFFYVADEDEGPRTVTGAAGAVCSVAGGAIHTFKNIGTTDSHLFVVIVPGGLDDFFKEIGEPTQLTQAPGLIGEPDMERLLTATDKYGIRLVGLDLG